MGGRAPPAISKTRLVFIGISFNPANRIASSRTERNCVRRGCGTWKWLVAEVLESRESLERTTHSPGHDGARRTKNTKRTHFCGATSSKNKYLTPFETNPIGVRLKMSWIRLAMCVPSLSDN